MTNIEIARLLRQVAASYAIKDEKKYRFQIIAYQKAADAIEHATSEVKELIHDGKLHGISGVGPSIQGHLEELVKTGSVKHFESIKSHIPHTVFPLLDIPSFGPKKAFKLVSAFQLTNVQTVIDDVAEHAENGNIAKLEGFGEKSAEDILQAIREYKLGKTKTSRMALPFATELSEKIIAYLKKEKAVVDAQPLGSLRRRVSTIGDVDIAVATDDPEKVLKHFVSYPHRERIIEQGPATSSILVSGGKQIDLMTQPPKGFGSLLQHFTGSKHHNIHLREYALKKGLSLSERGIKDKKTEKLSVYDTEEGFYKALGLSWIPPEMRENTGEIEFARKHLLPKLVELTDIRGDFHLHSSFPIEPSHDKGQDTIEVMQKKAQKLGYSYMGFSEHNPGISTHTTNEIVSLVEKKYKFIERFNRGLKNFRIFNLLEIDIQPNGKLALPLEAFDFLDGAIVSVHSSFSMSKDAMTERVLRGLSHKKARILAHPTGRLLNQRAGYELDWEKIFAFCVKNNKAIEINSWPLRLDLPDILVREAVKKGVKLVIDTDSHQVDQMDMMRFGVSVARRGWATKDDILNTLPYNKMIEWFKGGE